MGGPNRFAFYDLDGTLVSSNVVHQYGWYARNAPSRIDSWLRTARLLGSVPRFIVVDQQSRTKFNVIFYRSYRGLRREWLETMSTRLFDELFRPSMFSGARALVEADRQAGYQTVLVTGSLDFALGPLVRHFGFEHVISNRLVFRDGVATGEIEPPLIAEAEKVATMRRLAGEYNVDTANSKAYSDSMSDLPMLEAVGEPSVVNPGRQLRRIAEDRGWPVLDLKKTN
jgi:HAD superfamily hydrolase (TIGR01490 family)